MSVRSVKKHCTLENGPRELLERAVERFALSARAYHRILKVSRTIADLDHKAAIDESHVAEAIQYRILDKKMGL